MIQNPTKFLSNNFHQYLIQSDRLITERPLADWQNEPLSHTQTAPVSINASILFL